MIKDILSIVGSIAGLFVTLGVILCTTIPNIRNKIKDSILKDQKTDEIEDKLDKAVDKIDDITEMLQEQKRENELSREADTCLIRDRITRIYYKNIDNETLRSYELDNLNDLYEIYKKYDGNHYVDTIYDIMIKWKVVQ